MKHVMVDIETLGTRPGSVILSIGACRFDETGVGDRFYRPIDVFDSLMAGLTVDAATVGWWRLQSPEARDAFRAAQPLRPVLTEFAAYTAGAEGTYVWAKGPDFDLVLLDAAFQAIGMKRPWKYNAARDVRTILALAADAVGLGPSTTGVAHHALDDAVRQAEQVRAAAAALEVELA